MKSRQIQITHVHVKEWDRTIKQFTKEATQCPQHHTNLLNHLSCSRVFLAKTKMVSKLNDDPNYSTKEATK